MRSPSTVCATIAHRLGRVGQRHLEPAAGDDARGLADDLAVEEDLAVGREVGGLGAREAEQAREGGVDTLALETLRDRKAALLPHRQDRRPSISMPRSDRITMRIAEQTIAESARLNVAKFWHVDEVDDVAAQEAGVAEEPVDEVADRAAEQAAERDGPARGCRACATSAR